MTEAVSALPAANLSRFGGPLLPGDTVDQYLTEPATAGTIYIERRFNVCRVPTVEAVRDFLELFRWGSRWRAFFSVAFYAGLRPCEICALTTDMIIVDGERWVGLVYPVGKPKPTGRPAAGHAPKRAERKWNRIDERRGDVPPGAFDALRAYWLAERQDFGLLFPGAHSQYGKAFSEARKRMVALGHSDWSRTNADYYQGRRGKAWKIEYDITPYSGRRFFVTAYHYLRTAEGRRGLPDPLDTQRRMAHNSAKDTRFYIHAWRDLGLRDDTIGAGWRVLTGAEPGQKRLVDYSLDSPGTARTRGTDSATSFQRGRNHEPDERRGEDDPNAPPHARPYEVVGSDCDGGDERPPQRRQPDRPPHRLAPIPKRPIRKTAPTTIRPTSPVLPPTRCPSQ